MHYSITLQRRKLTILAAVVGLSLAVVTPATAITWGTVDEYNTYSNVGAIMAYFPAHKVWWPICSGTLIGENIFLTAGHCTSGLDDYPDPDQIRVTFDWDPLSQDPGSYLLVAQALTHPKYNGFRPRSNPHDVGILILAEPVDDGITPASLPAEGYLDELRDEGALRQGKEEADFTVVGYGATLYFPPPRREYHDQRQFAESEFQTLLKSWLRLSQNQATGDGGSSYGDSGGPAFWVDPETNEETLVGITSWGDIPCVATAFCYRVDTADTLGFIDFAFGLAEVWLDPEADDPEPPNKKK